MTCAYNSMQTVLCEAFSKATNILFVWESSPKKRLPRAPIGILSLGHSITLGRDHHRYTFRDSDISLDLYGHRELTINVQVRARLAKTASSSRILAEKSRLALANPSFRDDLRRAQLVFVETHPLVNLDFSRSNRKELRSSFDVVFRLMLHEQTSDKNTGYFDHIETNENVV